MKHLIPTLRIFKKLARWEGRFHSHFATWPSLATSLTWKIKSPATDFFHNITSATALARINRNKSYQPVLPWIYCWEQEFSSLLKYYKNWGIWGEGEEEPDGLLYWRSNFDETYFWQGKYNYCNIYWKTSVSLYQPFSWDIGKNLTSHVQSNLEIQSREKKTKQKTTKTNPKRA